MKTRNILILLIVLLSSCGQSFEPIEETTALEEPSIKEVTYQKLQGTWELQSVWWWEMQFDVTIEEEQVFFTFTGDEIIIESDHEFIESMKTEYRLFDKDDIKEYNCFGDQNASDNFINMMVDLKTIRDSQNSLRNIWFSKDNMILKLNQDTYFRLLEDNQCGTWVHGPIYTLIKKNTNSL